LSSAPPSRTAAHFSMNVNFFRSVGSDKDGGGQKAMIPLI
jgi:hypothetical protein